MPPFMAVKQGDTPLLRSNGEAIQLDVDGPSARLTHRLFRFPAKFHPPAIRTLIERFTDPGDHLYEPFCGSGTALVEAAIGGRRSTGVDLDPLAVMVSRAKTRRYNLDELESTSKRLLESLSRHDRGSEAYEQLQWEDISEKVYAAAIQEGKLSIPAIPNLHHWFRRYVIIDLARIRLSISQLRQINPETRGFFVLIFASIIRNSSNADPVPVSGLEVTAHMKAKDRNGRIIDPYTLYRKALKRSLLDIKEWLELLGSNEIPTVLQGDVTEPITDGPSKVSAVITSPPYHSAVDYYRRHQLEMFWLRLTNTHAERLKLLPRYIGRARVRQSHPLLDAEWPTEGLAAEWENLLSAESEQRARDFRHYILSMSRTFEKFAQVTASGAPVVVVVGSSTWNGKHIPTADLFYELAGDAFEHEVPMWYPVKNRYMSYSRHNNANIDKEYVVVLRRK